jgi:isopenicillin N synthase-like dioxygenase
MENGKYQLDELNRETALGGDGVDYDREVPCIDMHDFSVRKAEIADAIWTASCDIGFFQVTGHGIEQSVVDEAFAISERFFNLPMEAKGRLTMEPGTNAGWEFRAQVRPSTGTPDHKESYQITLPRMSGLWPGEDAIPGFHDTMLRFEKANWTLGMQILSCFALKLGFAEDFFTRAHEPSSPDYQSTLRLVHYMAMDPDAPASHGEWRAGAHSDFDCLTLLHQRVGQGGLQLCPGNEAGTGRWTDVTPVEGAVTCNIGDMLMRWSDDKLNSTLHRVRMPRAGEYHGKRLSIPFFCQANRDVMIEGPLGKYAPITAAEYLSQRIAANFAATRG